MADRRSNLTLSDLVTGGRAPAPAAALPPFEAIERDARARGLSAGALTELRRIYDREAQAGRVAGIAAQEREAQGASLVRRLAGSGGAAAINFANTGTLGFLPNIVGALGGDQQAVADAVLASQETNPLAATVGTLGGVLRGGTPAAGLAGGASRLATRAFGTQRLAQAAVGSRFAARAGAQILNNLVGGTGAITALRLVERSDLTLQERITRAAEEAASIENIGLSIGFGAFQARFLRPKDKALSDLFQQYERKTGKRIPADVAGDDPTLGAIIDTIAQTPGLERDAQQAARRLVRGLREVLEEQAGRRGAAGSRAASRTRAGRAVRELLDEPASVLGPARRGSVTAGRQIPEAQAMAAEGGTRLTSEQRAFIVQGLRSAVRTGGGRARSDVISDDWRGVIRSTIDRVREGSLTVRELEALRQRTAEVAHATNPVSSLRARVEAGRFYETIREAIDRSAPQYSRALANGERLRRIEEALDGVAASNVDDTLLRSFWTGRGDPVARYEAARQTMTPADFGAVRGWYFNELIDRASLKDGTLSQVKLDALLRSSGAFNEQVVERVLPGMPRWMRMAAEARRRAEGGSLAPRGSRTFGRGARLALSVGFRATQVAGTVTSLLTNPFWAVASILGPEAVKWTAQRQARSLVNGHLGQTLSALAQGQPSAPMGRAPAALATAGGARGIGEAALEAAPGAITDTATLLQQLATRAQQTGQAER